MTVRRLLPDASRPSARRRARCLCRRDADDPRCPAPLTTWTAARDRADPIPGSNNPGSSSPLRMPVFFFRPSVEWMTQHDGLLAIRPGRDDVDRDAGELLQAFEIGARVFRQTLVRGHADG